MTAIPITHNPPTTNPKRHLHLLATLALSLILFSPPLSNLAHLAQTDDRYSHTPLIPLLAAALTYLESRRFPKTRHNSTHFYTLTIFSACAAALTAPTWAAPAHLLTIQIATLTLIWIAAFLLFYGPAALRAAAFPATFLLLAIPLPSPVMDQISFWLQAASAELSHLLFRLLGVPVFRQGHTFALPGITIEVAEQCSGIRSATALIITSILTGYAALHTHSRRTILVLATAFVAILKNAARIVFLSTMAVYVDESILSGLLHHKYGGTVFTLFALAMLAPVLLILRKSERGLNMPKMNITLLTLLLLLTACTRNPETAKKQYLQSGQTYAKKSDFKSAIVEYQNALQYDRKNVDVLHSLAEAYLANRQPREAYAALMQAVAVDPNRSDVRLNLGRLYLSANDFKKAEEQAASIVERDPSNVAAHQILGASLAGQNQHEKALQVFEKVAQLAPKESASFVNLGISQSAAGKTADAERNLRRAAELDPRNPAAYLALATFHRRANQLPQAEQALRAGIEATPTAVNLYLAIAELHAAQSRPDQLDATLNQLRDRVPKPEVALAIGDFLAARGQRDRAIAEFKRGVELAPKDLELKTRLVEHHLAAGQVKEAENWNNQILRDRPKDVRAGIARGRILLAQGKRDEATAALRQQVSDARDSAQAHHYLGLAYVRNMQHSQAKTEFQEAIRLDGGFLPARLSLAELHINLNELAPAREVAEAAVRTFPNHPTVRTLLASVHLRQRNIAGAREHLAAAQNFAPNDPAVHVMLGVSYAGERKFAEAEREFEAALKLSPRYTPALAELAGLWNATGQSAKAVARLKQHTAANRDDADSHLLLGSICRQSRDYPCAEAALTRAAELAPQNIQTRIQLGGVHQDQGRTDAAIQQYEQALKIEPRSAGIHALLGTLKLKKGDMDGARKHYEQGMSIDPNSAVIANNLAVTNALRSGNLDQAMALAQKAREMSPDLVNAADTLGWIQYQKGLYSSAIRHLEEAVRKAPESGTYQYHLGMALVAAGQKDKGRTHLEAATRLKIDPDDAAQARTALAKVR